MPRLTALLALVLLALAGCATPAGGMAHRALVASGFGAGPLRAVILETDIGVYEISTGGVVEEVPAWSEAAVASVTAALETRVRGMPGLEIVPLPALDPAEQGRVDEHLALYRVVGGAAFLLLQGGDPAWRHKARDFDYTLGPGLAFLARRSGAEAALVVLGEDFVSSEGRQALAAVGARLGIGVDQGHALLVAGLVDLATGRILWMGHALSYAPRDLRQAADAEAMIQEVLAVLPGGSA